MKKVTDDIYRGCCYGYFVIYDDISEEDCLNFKNKKWCGKIISDNTDLNEIKDWISTIKFNKSLKITLDEHYVPTMIHYLKINKQNSDDIIKQFFTQEYDLYYKIYEHGFLKRIPYIDIKYNVEIDNFLKTYHYSFNFKNQLFIHDRYKNL
jgi:cyclopropane fatty-acyl-phospholipid synthase-like methyltransferase